MNDDPQADPPGDHKPAKPLTKVLGQSEAVKGLVDEAAQELSLVSAVLRQEVSDPGAPPGIESVLEKTETIEDKVQDAADKLSDVNAALKREILERHVLEFRLAAVTERAESSRNAAFHDLLTGLPNRALLNDRLDHGLAQARRHARNLAVMFIDLDGFKTVNDTHGHDVGDAVLKTIAARLMASTRDEDTVSRQGGDEFLYVLTEVDNPQGLTQIAEKLLAAIQMPCSLLVDAVQVDVCLSASIGIAVFPQHGATAQDLIRSADKAMYRAKAGKTHIALHDAVSPLAEADP